VPGTPVHKANCRESIEQCHGTRQRPSGQEIVRIEPYDEFTGGYPKPIIECNHVPGVSAMAHHRDALILVGKMLGDSCAVISRSVIDDDDFWLYALLRKRATDALRQKVPIVEAGNNY
jgi:hypothetical protein